ncbi:MAG: Ig-like domain-containing protein [Gemmatimonas sp.]
MLTQLFRNTALVTTLVLATACSEDATAPLPVQNASLSIVAPTATVYEADAVVLTAVYRDANGAVVPNAPVTWSAQDTTRVQQGANGYFLALRSGVVTVTAKSGGITASYNLNIVRPSVLAVAVLMPTTTFARGDVVTVGVRSDGPGGRVINGRTVTLSSDNPNVALVDASGRVRGVSAGSATIRATVDGTTGSVPVTITQNQTHLVLSKFDGANLPLLVATDSVMWNGRAEYHEVYAEAGTFSLSGSAPLRYATDIRYAEYNVTTVNGRRQMELRLVHHDRDTGLVEYDARGDLQLTSEVVYPLVHFVSPQSGGMEVQYRIGGTDAWIRMFFRREPE